MGVYLPIKDYSAIQGPAPSGFHVPLTSEWTALYSILTTTLGLTGDGNLMKSYLKAPFAGIREGSTSNVKGQGSYGYFWLSTPGTSNLASEVYFTSSSITNYADARSKAFTIRCFKNSPVSPDNTWTTLYDGSSIAAGAGIFHNTTLGLISISGDGLTWITIADKNLGATTVYNDGDTLSESNCGYYYQRGNNYGFAWTGSVTTSSTTVDASNYGPGNYYNSNTFITNSGNWDSSNNADLWGGVTGVVFVQKELKNAYIGIPFPTSIVLDKSSIKLTTVGQTVQLTATIEPTVSDKTITWSSDDTTVATVSTTGLVTCVTPGTCTITATTVNGLTASCGVTDSGSRLPSAYQEVEWIGSSKTQYINTGFTPTVNTSIVTSLSLGSNSGWAVFFGVTGNDSSSDGVLGRIYSDTSGSFNPWFCNANYDETIAYISTDVFHDIELSANTLYIDGNSYTITTTGTPWQSPMDLFAGNNGGNHGWRKSSCKIKSFTIEDSGNTVRDFVPCYRIADGVIGMYDLVNDVFYTNQGSGTFTKGNDV